MKAIFPSSCAVCHANVMPGEEIADSGLRGPRGGKKMGHVRCVGAKRNPANVDFSADPGQWYDAYWRANPSYSGPRGHGDGEIVACESCRKMYRRRDLAGDRVCLACENEQNEDLLAPKKPARRKRVAKRNGAPDFGPYVPRAFPYGQLGRIPPAAKKNSTAGAIFRVLERDGALFKFSYQRGVGMPQVSVKVIAVEHGQVPRFDVIANVRGITRAGSASDTLLRQTPEQLIDGVIRRRESKQAWLRETHDRKGNLSSADWDAFNAESSIDDGLEQAAYVAQSWKPSLGMYAHDIGRKESAEMMSPAAKMPRSTK